MAQDQREASLAGVLDGALGQSFGDSEATVLGIHRQNARLQSGAALWIGSKQIVLTIDVRQEVHLDAKVRRRVVVHVRAEFVLKYSPIFLL